MRILAGANETPDHGAARLMDALLGKKYGRCPCEPSRELTAAVLCALQALKPRQAAVIGMRFGLDGSEPETLEKIGRRFAVTGERIRQIQVDGLRRLRHPSRGKHLRVFLSAGEKAA